jgi:pimeloyl-ACP methyl ester carboxylesterase
MAEIKSIYPNLIQNLTQTSSGSTVCSYTSDLGSGPILTLIHGYPQSAFIWRHVIPELIDKVSLFVPELPGYGVSTACKQHDRKTVGGALLEALTSVFNIESPRKVILGGHDRGARTCHRLAVDKADFPALEIVGTVLLDIMPTKVQWEKFATPAVAVGYFHWPFLANTAVSVPMIEAYGGGRWVKDAFRRIQGTSEVGQRRFTSDNAWEVHAKLFDKKEAIEGSCEDYASGSQPEVTAQSEDQKSGRKIAVPTLVMFSKAKLGSTADVAEIWKDWIEPGTDYEAIAVSDGHGHYLPEEACDWVSDAMKKFIEKVG